MYRSLYAAWRKIFAMRSGGLSALRLLAVPDPETEGFQPSATLQLHPCDTEFCNGPRTQLHPPLVAQSPSVELTLALLMKFVSPTPLSMYQRLLP